MTPSLVQFSNKLWLIQLCQSVKCNITIEQNLLKALILLLYTKMYTNKKALTVFSL